MFIVAHPDSLITFTSHAEAKEWIEKKQGTDAALGRVVRSLSIFYTEKIETLTPKTPSPTVGIFA